MSRLPLLRHRRAKLFALTALGVALALLFAGCPAGDRAGSTSTVRVLHAFGGADGAWPRGSLVAAGGFLYGGTTVGGDANSGTVFRHSARRNRVSKPLLVHRRQGQRLRNQPHHNSLLLIGDALIGAARQGGNTNNNAGEGAQKDGNGTIFRIETSGSAYAVLDEVRRWQSVQPQRHTVHLRFLPTARRFTA